MNNFDPFIQKTKQTLERQPLGQDIRQQLAHARRQALQQPQRTFLTRHAGAAVAFASIVAVALAVTLTYTVRDNPIQMDNAEAFEIITSNESLEMYEDLEFYLWLDEELKPATRS